MIGLIPHSWLNDLGIPPWVWNPLSISLHAAFEATIVVAILGVALGYILAKGRFPGRDVIETVLSLPMYPELTADQVHAVIAALKGRDSE